MSEYSTEKNNGINQPGNNKKIPNLYLEKSNCCGCTACYAICPVNAIRMVVDKEGFLYPLVNEKLCICCYKCENVCPTK